MRARVTVTFNDRAALEKQTLNFPITFQDQSSSRPIKIMCTTPDNTERELSPNGPCLTHDGLPLRHILLISHKFEVVVGPS